MKLTEQLRVLQAAGGDPAKLALATVDLKYPQFSEAERASLKEALETAAIPHWCDEAILAALLEVSLNESAARLARLRALTVVEPFPARGETAVNVHESARLALRSALVNNLGERFQGLSGRAAAFFEDDLTASGRIEWIYHLLCADPDRGATELEELDCAWSSSAHPEDRYALAAALREIEDTGLVQGRARVWVLLVMAWTRASRGEAARLEDVAQAVLQLAKDAADAMAEAAAHCLIGDVLQAQGKLGKARAAFGEYLEICRRLAEKDPTNAGWQRELALAHSRVGDVLQAQGKLGEAQAAFGEYLEISRRLVEQDPTSAGWQRDLAVAHSRVGEVLQAQGKLGEAQAAFGEMLEINRWLAEKDPTNADWQRELAVAHGRVGEVLQAQEKLGEAQAAFGEMLEINRRLAEKDPANTDWQYDLGCAVYRAARILQTLGDLEGAQTMFEEALSIGHRLAEKDPTNAVWQRELAVTHGGVGDVLLAQGKLGEAQAAFGEMLEISRRLAQKDPTNAAWQRDLTVARGRVGDVLLALGKLK